MGRRSTSSNRSLIFSPSKPSEVQTVGYSIFAVDGIKRERSTSQYVYPRKWLLATVTLLKENHKTVVTGVHVEPLPDSLQKI